MICSLIIIMFKSEGFDGYWVCRKSFLFEEITLMLIIFGCVTIKRDVF